VLYSVSATRSFSASHRVVGHPLCQRGHGHRWTVTARSQHEEVDAMGYPRGGQPICDALDRIVGELVLRDLDVMIPGVRTTTVNLAAWFFERLLSLGLAGMVEVEVENELESGRVTRT
jgi:6-pyruvoyl-tetrahydropterin synthase